MDRGERPGERTPGESTRGTDRRAGRGAGREPQPSLAQGSYRGRWPGRPPGGRSRGGEAPRGTDPGELTRGTERTGPGGGPGATAQPPPRVYTLGYVISPRPG